MKYRPLLWHLYPSYLLVIMLALTAMSGYAVRAMHNFMLLQIEKDLEERALLIAPQIIDHLDPLDQSEIDRICKSVTPYAKTRFTAILASGKVVGDSYESPQNMDNHARRPEIQKALRQNRGASIRYSRTLEKEMMYLAIPLWSGEEPENRVRILLRSAVSIVPINERLTEIRWQILIWGIMVAIAAAGISFLISRRIARPIREMKQGAKHFAEGDLSYRLPTPNILEMQGLARAMNEMAARLDDRVRAVERRKNELDSVLSSMSEGVIAVDREDRILSINRAAAAILDRVPEKITGRSLQEAVRNPSLQRLARQALEGEPVQESDIVFFQSSEQILLTHTSPLKEADGRTIGILIVLNDVTRLRRLESMRRDFAANVSHEIKTPLTAIKGFVETLRAGALNNPEEAERFLTIIERHVDRLCAIIEDILSLSRIEEGREGGQIHRRMSPVEPMLQNAVSICREKAEEKEILMEIDCGPGVRARMNAPLMEQALVNLLDNAIKYSEQKGTVRISAQEKPDAVTISVADSGIGIPNAHIPRLFERFYRVDKARSRSQGGTGLGLAIVKHIVQSHNSGIEVESTPGKGSIFTIHIPKEEPYDRE